jgi:hypothetical protein
VKLVADIPAGSQVGAWTVGARERLPSDGKAAYRCVCACGTSKLVRHALLIRERSLSCGCQRSERITKANTTHGMSFTPVYKSWRSMLDRCFNPGATKFSDYGARGVTVCESWRHSFEQFLSDMGEDPRARHWIAKTMTATTSPATAVGLRQKSKQTIEERERKHHDNIH